MKKLTQKDYDIVADLAAIDYFTKLQEEAELEDKLHFMKRITIPDLRKKFGAAKLMQLRHKHGVLPDTDVEG